MWQQEHAKLQEALHWTPMVNGSNGRRPPRLGLNVRRSFGAGLNGRDSHLKPVTLPGLKLPTQSQMADVDLNSLFFTRTSELRVTLNYENVSSLSPF